MNELTSETRGPEGPGAVEELARDPGSRKRFLKMVGGAGAASAFSIFLAACNSDDDGGGGSSAESTGGSSEANPGSGATSTRQPNADPREGTSDLEILNYALKLEQLETAFYAAVIDSGLIKGSQLAMVKKFASNERQHRETLETTISNLGGTPVEPAKVRFPIGTAKGVLSLAATIENGGAAAYLGQANRIRDKEVLAAALSIHSVEARHAATLNELVGRPFAPQGSFAAPLTMEEVLTSVQTFIVT